MHRGEKIHKNIWYIKQFDRKSIYEKKKEQRGRISPLVNIMSSQIQQ